MTLEYKNFYYDHEVNSYPALQEDIKIDIAIIGGGFSGINCAFELASKGKQVAVLEASHVGYGASGRNGGQLITGYSFEPENMRGKLGNDKAMRLQELADESVNIVKQRIDEHSIDCDFTEGYCDLAVNAKQWKYCQKKFTSLQAESQSERYQLYDQQQLTSQVLNSSQFKGGLLDRQSGHLHPYKLVTAEAKIATEKGARIFENSAVQSFKKIGNTYQLYLESCTVTCDILVFATNAYNNKLSWRVDGGAISATSYIVATEPLSQEVIQQTIKSDYAFCDLNTVLDYFRLSSDRRLLYGGSCDYSGFKRSNFKEYLTARMLRVFPTLKNQAIEYYWGGNISVGFNRVPQIGRINPQFYHCSAYAGHGINNTHLAARMISDKIINESADFDIFNSVSHLWFPPINSIRGPLTSLYMSYLRAIDAVF